jgi:hypothetical protein
MIRRLSLSLLGSSRLFRSENAQVPLSQLRNLAFVNCHPTPCSRYPTFPNECSRSPIGSSWSLALPSSSSLSTLQDLLARSCKVLRTGHCHSQPPHVVISLYLPVTTHSHLSHTISFPCIRAPRRSSPSIVPLASPGFQPSVTALPRHHALSPSFPSTS